MGRVTIGQSVQSALGNLEAPLELCDEQGNVLGHFFPVQDRSIYEGVESPNSPEEIERRLREDSERTLDEIFRDLERRQ